MCLEYWTIEITVLFCKCFSISKVFQGRSNKGECVRDTRSWVIPFVSAEPAKTVQQNSGCKNACRCHSSCRCLTLLQKIGYDGLHSNSVVLLLKRVMNLSLYIWRGKVYAATLVLLPFMSAIDRKMICCPPMLSISKVPQMHLSMCIDKKNIPCTNIDMSFFWIQSCWSLLDWGVAVVFIMHHHKVKNGHVCFAAMCVLEYDVSARVQVVLWDKRLAMVMKWRIKYKYTKRDMLLWCRRLWDRSPSR